MSSISHINKENHALKMYVFIFYGNYWSLFRKQETSKLFFLDKYLKNGLKFGMQHTGTGGVSRKKLLQK